MEKPKMGIFDEKRNSLYFKRGLHWIVKLVRFFLFNFFDIKIIKLSLLFMRNRKRSSITKDAIVIIFKKLTRRTNFMDTQNCR